ncbi:hypothetical protein ACFQEX_00450 [Roseibium salinum]
MPASSWIRISTELSAANSQAIARARSAGAFGSSVSLFSAM